MPKEDEEVKRQNSRPNDMKKVEEVTRVATNKTEGITRLFRCLNFSPLKIFVGLVVNQYNKNTKDLSGMTRQYFGMFSG